MVQLQPQPVRDFSGDLSLNREDILEPAIVIGTPELRLMNCVHQFRVYDQAITALDHLSGKDNPYAELATGLRDVTYLSFVAEHCGARNDAQFMQLRQVVNDSRRDALA